MRYERARVSLDRHATYIVTAFIAGAPVEPQRDQKGVMRAPAAVDLARRVPGLAERLTVDLCEPARRRNSSAVSLTNG